MNLYYKSSSKQKEFKHDAWTTLDELALYLVLSAKVLTR